MRSGLRSRPWAGLDVGTFSVKLLATHGPGPASRRRLAEVPLPADDGDGRRPPEVVARAVAAALERARLSPRGLRGVTVGISGADVIVKQISLPLLDDAEVGQALRFEARKHLPFDPQTMVIDYQVLGRYLSERRVDVLLAAVSQEHLDDHLAPLQLLGLEADIVDAAPLALVNALIHAEGAEAGTLALLDIGHRSSHLAIFQRDEPFFSRRLDFGGRALTLAIARETRRSVEEAEAWKVGARDRDARADWERPELQAVLGVLQGELVEELRRSFAFYRTFGRLPELARLRLSGGTARLPGLAERLAEALGHPVEPFDPLGLDDAGPVGPHFVQAWGLALRTA